MERFIRRENLRLLREKLTRTTDEKECKCIVGLIKEEELRERYIVADGRDHTY